MRYLYMNEPAIAERWSKEYPNQKISKLPEKKSAAKTMINKLKVGK